MIINIPFTHKDDINIIKNKIKPELFMEQKKPKENHTTSKKTTGIKKTWY